MFSDKRIADLPAVAAEDELAGTELVEIVVGGVRKTITLELLKEKLDELGA